MPMATLMIHPDFRALLQAAGLDTFDALFAAAEGPQVDGHRTRGVARIELAAPGGRTVGVFVKRRWGADARPRWRDLLHFRWPMTPARREWQNVLRLRRAGIAVSPPVAWGFDRAGEPRALTAFREVGGPSLAEWLADAAEHPVPRALRARVIRTVAFLARRLHEAGLSFPDFYAKHVYLPGVAVGQPRAVLIDVQRLRWATGGRKAGDLARLYVSASDHGVSRKDCARLVRAYLGNEPPGPLVRPPNLLGKLGEDLGHSVAHDLISRDEDDRRRRRALHDEARHLIARIRAAAARMPGRGRDPNLIAARRSPPAGVASLVHETMTEIDEGRLLVNEAFRPALEAAGLVTLDALMRVGGQLYREGFGRSTVRVELPDPDGGPPRAVYVKRYTRIPWWMRLRRTFSLNPPVSQARHEMRGIVRLADLGIASMRCVAVGEALPRRGRRERSCVVTEEVAGATQADEYFEAVFAGPLSPEQRAAKRDLIARIADLARRMHAANLSHRDFYLCHILVRRTEGGEPVLHLIDLQRLTHHRRGIGRRWVVKDLAALLFSSQPGPATGIRSPLFTNADRLRFARLYFGTDRLTAEHKDVLRAVVRKARRIARHDARKRRRTGGTA